MDTGETLYWLKKTLQDGSILLSVRYAEPVPGLFMWHARYDPRRFSFLHAQTQEALRIAGLENAPTRRQAEYWAGRSLMMLALGLQTPPGRMLSGAPYLPDGFNCSLSHSSDNILLLVGPEGGYVGVDIERRLKPVALQSVISRVATSVEQCWLHSLVGVVSGKPPKFCGLPFLVIFRNRDNTISNTLSQSLHPFRKTEISRILQADVVHLHL